MKSPFAIFRKHQKLALVILLLMVMVAFTLGPALTRISSGGRIPTQLVVLLLASVGALVFWVIGTQTKRGKPSNYALTGAVIGLAVGWFVPGVSGPAPAVTTSIGRFSERELDQLVRRRQLANRFVQLAFSRTNKNRFARPANLMFSFGRPPDEDVVLGLLFRKEADEMGVVVSDDAITSYIKQITGNNLSEKAFVAILKNMGVRSQSQLYDILRDELKARLAMQMLVPRSLPTPQQYWQYFRRLNVKQELEVAEVPVSAFTADVPEPSKDELYKFFEEHKTLMPNEKGPGTPGFRQPRKVQLAFLEADYEKFEAQVLSGIVKEEIEEEIEKFYEDNKENYRTNPFERGDKKSVDESKPILPEFSPESDNEPAVAKKPGDTESNEQPAVATKPQQPEYRQLDDELRDEIRDELLNEKTLSRMKADIRDAYQEMRKIGDEYYESLGNDTSTQGDEDKQENAGKMRPREIDNILRKYADTKGFRYVVTGLLSAEELSNGEKYPIGSATAPASGESEPQDAPTVVSQLFGDQSSQLYTPYEAEDQATSHRFVYWTIDDVPAHIPVFGEVDANTKVGSVAGIGGTVLDDLNRRLGEAEQRQESEFGVIDKFADAAEFLKHIGKQPGRIPKSPESFNWRRYRITVLDGNQDEIVKLKIEEPGIEEQVRKTWKQVKARRNAEERANALKAIALKEMVGGKSLSDVLDGQPIRPSGDKPAEDGQNTSGDKPAEDGQNTLNVRSTELFSWMRISTAPPTGLALLSRPELSTISAVDKADEEFMKFVFEELQEGEVGVVPNADRSSYYVVQVKNRTPGAPGNDLFEKQFMDARFFGTSMFGQWLPSEYSHLSNRDQQAISFEWSRRLEKKYAVHWNPHRKQRGQRR